MHVGDLGLPHPEIAGCLGHEGAWTDLLGGNATEEAVRMQVPGVPAPQEGQQHYQDDGLLHKQGKSCLPLP